MLTLGLRIFEAVTLTVGAIDSRQMVIRLVSKGNKERLLPLPAALLEALRTFWRTHRHPHWLFPNRAGTDTVNRQAVRHAFAAARDSLGLDRAFTPHCLRHAWASTMLERGTELRYLQLLLGHANLSSTEVYTHLTTPMQDQLRTQVDRLCHDLLPEGDRHV
jgi:integrase/recombinase XerD